MAGSFSRTTAFHPAMRLNTRAQSCQRRRHRECSATQELLHPAAQVIPALVNLKMHPTIWRLSDDGPGASRTVSIGRHPKASTNSDLGPRLS
jgi:hypothetical protein